MVGVGFNKLISFFVSGACLFIQSRAEQSSFRAGPPGPPGSTSDLGGYVDTSPPGHTCQKRDPKEGVFLRTNIYPGRARGTGKKRNEEKGRRRREGRPKKGGGRSKCSGRATSDERRAEGTGTGTDNHAGLVLYWDEAITLPSN